MKTLETKFWRKGILYEQLDRTDLVAFFKLSVKIPGQKPEHCGYEVIKICTHEDMTISGRFTPSAEYLPSDEQFGKDGDKVFFPHDLERASNYFSDFDMELRTEKCGI
jgi:hypothetical protein